MALPQPANQPSEPHRNPGPLRCVVDRSELLRALNQVAFAMTNREKIPSLLCVRLSARPDGLHVWGTDLELGIEVTIPAAMRRYGDIAPSLRPLLTLLRVAPDAPLELEATPDMLGVRVRWADANYLLFGTHPGHCVQVPVARADTDRITVDARDLHGLSRRTMFAAAHDETRPYLTGLQFRVVGGQLQAVATDSVRIACSRVDLDAIPFSFPESIIPGRSCVAVFRALGPKPGGTVEIKAHPSDMNVFVRIGNRLIVTRRLEGQYPDVLRLVPTKYDQVSTLDRLSLLGVLRRQQILTADGAVKLTLGDQGVSISATSPERGSATERVQGIHQGDPLDIGFCSRYLIEALACLDAETVLFETTSSRNPARLRPVGDDGTVHVILPLITY